MGGTQQRSQTSLYNREPLHSFVPYVPSGQAGKMPRIVAPARFTALSASKFCHSIVMGGGAQTVSCRILDTSERSSGCDTRQHPSILNQACVLLVYTCLVRLLPPLVVISSHRHLLCTKHRVRRQPKRTHDKNYRVSTYTSEPPTPPLFLSLVLVMCSCRRRNSRSQVSAPGETRGTREAQREREMIAHARLFQLNSQATAV